MIKSTDFTLYKSILVKQLKQTLQMPTKGKVEPMMEMFYKYDPEHIVIQNYLQ